MQQIILLSMVVFVILSGTEAGTIDDYETLSSCKQTALQTAIDLDDAKLFGDILNDLGFTAVGGTLLWKYIPLGCNSRTSRLFIFIVWQQTSNLDK